ncbi:MAG: hypothetical protein ACOY0T_33075 [Myxococcota bacterium]
MVSHEHDEQSQGVRFELRLCSSDEHAASYSVSVRAQGSEWVGDVHLTPPAGDVAFQFAAGEPPAPCLSIVRAAVRAIYREHERAGFPRRVTRWRPLPSAIEPT